MAIDKGSGMQRHRVVGYCGRVICLVAIGALVPAPLALAQASPPSGPARPVFSMGQPRRWEPYAVGSGVFGGSDDRAGWSAAFGVHRPIMNPVTGLFGVSGEGYASLRDGDVEGGARL